MELSARDIASMAETSERMMPYTAVILRPQAGRNPGGGHAKTDYVVVDSDVPCDIFTVSVGNESGVSGRVQVATAWVGYFPRDTDIKASYRIEDSTGRKFDITSVDGENDPLASEIEVQLSEVTSS
jgi:hypothetical protein